MSYLTVKDLCIKLGAFELKSLNLEVDEGEYAVIIGPTGAGKSILLECIIGFWEPEKGDILLEGKSILNDLPEKRGISIVYQDYALLPHLSVYKNIAYGLRKIDKKVVKEKVHEIAESLHIDHLLDRKPGTLSGGEQQRTALARSLVVNPRLLLMDEPLSALDPSTRKEIRKLFCDVIDKTATTVIHVTHDMKDLWVLADKVAILNGGEVVQSGIIQDIFERPVNKFVADFVGASIWDADVSSKVDNTTMLKTQGFFISSSEEAREGSRVKVVIRPEEVQLFKEPQKKLNGHNLFEARVKHLRCEGDVWDIGVQIGDTVLTVNSTKNLIYDLNLKAGDMVYAKIDNQNVRIIH